MSQFKVRYAPPRGYPLGTNLTFRICTKIVIPIFNLFMSRDWKGAENIPSKGRVIVASNHMSYLDVLVFTHFLYRNGRAPRYLGKAGVFKVPVIGKILLAAGQVPVERESSDAKKAVAEASRLAAEAQRKETSEFEQFIATVDHGVTPIQRMQDTLRQAQEDFAHFGDKMNPEQIAAFTAYVADLNTKIGDLTFKERWDQMAEGITTATDAMTPFRSMIEDIGQGLEDSLVGGLTDAFSGFIDGTESAKEALRSFAASFVKEITTMIAKALILYAVQKLIGLASGSTAFGSFTQSFGGVYGDGGVFSGGKSVKAFAGGGIVNGPTLFPMTGGAGLMGEAGPEAIVPLTRQNGKLGVGASPVNVQVNNYAGADVQTLNVASTPWPRRLSMTARKNSGSFSLSHRLDQITVLSRPLLFRISPWGEPVWYHLGIRSMTSSEQNGWPVTWTFSAGAMPP